MSARHAHQSLLRFEWKRDVLVGLGFLILATFFYGSILGQFWTADDPPLMAAIYQNGIWAHFYDPAVWAENLPEPPIWGVFTPWIMVSFGVDWWVGGLNPIFAYIHQLASLSVVLFLLYKVLRLFFSFYVSLYACMLFMISLPVREAAHYLMERHYIEGLGFFLLSMLCYERALRKPASIQWSWALGSGFFYFMACSAKEIYAPLAALLPLLPWGQWGRRYLALMPCAFFALAYLLWRAYMLDPEFMSGYGGGHFNLGLKQWSSFGTEWVLATSMSATWQVGILTLAAALLVVALGTSLMAWLRAIALSLLTILPGYPFLGILPTRLCFLSILVVVIGFSCILDMFSRHGRLAFSFRKNTELPISGVNRQWLGGGMGLFFGLLMAPGYFSSITPVAKPEMERFKQEGRFALSATPEQGLINPSNRPLPFWWFFSSLARLRAGVMHDPAHPAVCYDPCACSPLIPRKGLRITAQGIQEALWPVSWDEGVCGSLTKPLSVSLSFEKERRFPLLKWRLGPYGYNGMYVFQLEDRRADVFGFEPGVWPKGSHPVGREGLFMRVRWLEYTGSSAISPPFEIRPDMQPIEWKRSE